MKCILNIKLELEHDSLVMNLAREIADRRYDSVSKEYNSIDTLASNVVTNSLCGVFEKLLERSLANELAELCPQLD